MSERAESADAVNRYDEEDSVCTGCGQIVDDSHSWCASCAPEVY